MKFPDSLNRLLEQFHADSFFLGGSELDVIRSALGRITESDRREIKAFLQKFLASPTNIHDLDQQMEASPADIFITPPDDIPIFLGLIRDLID
jgi:hypothetical protein